MELTPKKLYFFDDQQLIRAENYSCWEDAYIALVSYAEELDYMLYPNKAVSRNNKQIIQII